ncbi:hypothetical protein Tco_0778333 [Tanacetum coccineum]
MESYQKKVNLTALTLTFQGIKEEKLLTITSEPVVGLIYKKSKKEKRVIVIKEILKFCDATLKRVLERVKKFNLDVKHGYADPNLSDEDVEYMEFYDMIGTLEQDNMSLRGMLDVERQRVDRLRHSMSTMPTITHSGMTQDAINELVAKRVEETLKAYDATRNPGTEMGVEDDQQDDNVEANGDNGNGNGNVNGNGNTNVNNEGVLPVARECTY